MIALRATLQMAHFTVPEPCKEGFVASLLNSAGVGGRRASEFDALLRGEHRVVSWEQLVAEGCTCEMLLRCHPSSVLAWVRTSTGEHVTWRALRELPDGCTAVALLSAWGTRLLPETTRLMRIDTDALDSMGLTHEDVQLLAWSSERWVSLLGGVPILACEAAPQCTRPALRAEPLSPFVFVDDEPDSPTQVRGLTAQQLSRLQL